MELKSYYRPAVFLVVLAAVLTFAYCGTAGAMQVQDAEPVSNTADAGIVTAVLPETEATSGSSSYSQLETPEPPDIPAPDSQPEPEPPGLTGFSDIQGQWAADDILQLTEKGIMAGFPDNTFRPEAPVTRAEFAAMMVNGFDLAPGTVGGFDDTKGHWGRDHIAVVVAAGIMAGYDEQLFGPDEAITREQIASVLWRYARLKGYDVSVGENTNILSYTDAFDISEYAIPAMQWACGSGLLQDRTEGSIDPQGSASRAEIAVLLKDFLEQPI